MFTVDEGIYSVEQAEDFIRNAKLNGKCKNNKKIEYYNIICAFDIETTSFIEPNAPENDNKRSIMYIWQFAIDGHVIMGRTWNEFLELIELIQNTLALSLEVRLLVYVHNLNFEFSYICKLFEWDKVFATDTRRPIYALTSGGIEFRCSYILTNYSLAKLGEQLLTYKVSKLVGDLDYSKHRHYKTKLDPDTELLYCRNDVLVVSCYIEEQRMKEKGRICDIPLTATGYCRRFCRHECLYKGGLKGSKKQQHKYRALMKSMQITSLDEYEQLKRAYCGGFTHASGMYAAWTLKDIDSIDFTSSYPYCLLSEQYPMGTGKLVKPSSFEEFKDYLNTYCCIFDIEFHDLESTFEPEQYISISKCFTRFDVKVNNGRVVSAGILGCSITNVDYWIINKLYRFKSAKITNFRIYRKGYLPKELFTSIAYFYRQKTKLKGVKGKEAEYLTGKSLLNSVY